MKSGSGVFQFSNQNLLSLILPRLYLSSERAATHKPNLEKHHITHILVVGDKLIQRFPNEYKYHQIRVLDESTQNLKQYFKETNHFISTSLNQFSETNVLVHWYFHFFLKKLYILTYAFMK